MQKKNEVFANGLEVACKVADGKSVACFPDPCWSPPSPPAGPIVIPYPNTAFAKDLANGSKTVFISGKPVAQKNKSYFKTSTGNEPATRKYGMGLITHTIKGKAYFTSWSMDVKVEGFNVCRHTDLMTHNHASTTGNTGPWFYVDTRNEKNACRDDKKRIDRECKPGKEEGKKKNRGQQFNKRGKQDKYRKQILYKEPGAWKRSYCKTLMHKKTLKRNYPDNYIKQEVLDNLTQKIHELEIALQRVRKKLMKKVKQWTMTQTTKVIGRAAVKGWLGPVGWVLTAYDVGSTVIEYRDLINKVGKQLKKDIDNLRRLSQNIEDIRTRKLSNITLADGNAILAKFSPCLRARKCMLIPYSDDQKSKNKNTDDGCCQGQTLHHVIPKSQFKYSACYNYKENEAPCVCAEGSSHSKGGTHQELHKALEPKIETAGDFQGEIPYWVARDKAVEAFEEVFPYCSTACIAAQLNNYHKKASVCGPNEDIRLRAVNGTTRKVHKNPSITY